MNPEEIDEIEEYRRLARLGASVKLFEIGLFKDDRYDNMAKFFDYLDFNYLDRDAASGVYDRLTAIAKIQKGPYAQTIAKAIRALHRHNKSKGR